MPRGGTLSQVRQRMHPRKGISMSSGFADEFPSRPIGYQQRVTGANASVNFLSREEKPQQIFATI